jgi:peptidoglycan/LPS O-acetylase OafA/YrhL
LAQTLSFHTTQKYPANFDPHIESLRGLAALLVVFSHVLTNEFHLDPLYRLSGVGLYSTPGHLSVLVFFILSGYVIGLTNKNSIITNTERYNYLKKRFIRLYPLYILAIAFAVITAKFTHYNFTAGQVSLHAVFGQVLFTEVLYTNQPLWSLSYEAVYYLLFLVISRYKINPVIAAILCVIFGVINRFIPILHPVLTSYSFGACFWVLGLSLSRLQRKGQSIKFGILLSMLFLFLCYDRLDIFYRTLIHSNLNFTEREVHSFFQRAISFSDFALLLFCWPLLLRFTNRSFPGANLMEYIAFLSPALYLIAQIIAGRDVAFFVPLAGFIVFYIIALAIFFTKDKWGKVGEVVLDKLSPLGAISYGIYVIHFPLLMLFQEISFFSGSGITFFIRAFLYTCIVLVIGWLLEHKVQIWIKSRIS